MSKKVVTLGEIMLRLSTPDFKRFVQADTFDITYGGGEANVAAATNATVKAVGAAAAAAPKAKKSA
jgi:hypothetical protein